MPLLDAAARIRKRFAEAQETRPHAEHNLEAGQEFVAACVDYGHCVEGLHQAAQGRDAYRAKGQQAGSTMDAHHERIPRHNH